MKKTDVLLAVESMCTMLGEDQVVAAIATRVDEDSFNEKEITTGDIKRELERLYSRVDELETAATEEAIIEEMQEKN